MDRGASAAGQTGPTHASRKTTAAERVATNAAVLGTAIEGPRRYASAPPPATTLSSAGRGRSRSARITKGDAAGAVAMDSALKELERMSARHPHLRAALDRIERGPDGVITIGSLRRAEAALREAHGVRSEEALAGKGATMGPELSMSPRHGAGGGDASIRSSLRSSGGRNRSSLSPARSRSRAPAGRQPARRWSLAAGPGLHQQTQQWPMAQFQPGSRIHHFHPIKSPNSPPRDRPTTCRRRTSTRRPG